MNREALAEVVNHLVDGWTERIEYKVMRNRQIEERAVSVKQDSIITQLEGEVSGYPTGSLGVRWGKPGSRPPGTLDLLGHLESLDAYLRDMGATGRTREQRLRSLVSLDADEDASRLLLRDLRRFVRTARIMLGYDMPKRALRDVVCGKCEGVLAVAIDASSDVVCVGKPGERAPCGTVYARWQWVDLLETEL